MSETRKRRLSLDDGSQFRADGFRSLELVFSGDQSIAGSIRDPFEAKLTTSDLVTVVGAAWERLGSPTRSREVAAKTVEQAFQEAVSNRLRQRGLWSITARVRFGYDELSVHISLFDADVLLENMDTTKIHLPVGIGVSTYDEYSDVPFLGISHR